MEAIKIVLEDSLKLPKAILEMGPSYFKYILMKPTQRKISYMAALFFNCLRLTMIAMTLSLLLDVGNNVMLIADIVQSASAFMQGLKSCIPIVFYKDEILWLFDNASHFWSSENNDKVNAFYKQVLRILHFYKRLIFVTYCAYVPVALILHKLPFLTWIPPVTGGYYFIYTLQFIMLTFDAIIVAGADTFFIGTCLVIHAQFQILNVKMSNLGKNVKKIDNEIVECVKHHNFLLEYTNVLIKIFSIGLVFQFFVTTYSLCIEIVVFSKRDSVGMIIGVIYCFMLTSQLALYCFPADAVIEISHECANAIYDSPWYDHTHELRNAVVNCIQRAHKRIIFTAGGFIDIDKRAFTKIFKGILSLNTLMKNLFENETIKQH